jgi:PHP family Zn ribbon phosphoesterase
MGAPKPLAVCEHCERRYSLAKAATLDCCPRCGGLIVPVTR